MKLSTAALLATLTAAGCQSPEAVPATCSPCGDIAIACTATIPDCIGDGGGVCHVGNLDLHADETLVEHYPGNLEVTGTWAYGNGGIVLQPQGEAGQTLAFSDYAASCGTVQQ